MIGTVFKIKTNSSIFYGCVTSYYSTNSKKPNSIGFIVIKHPESTKLIGRITVPAGIIYSFFTSPKWIEKHWKILGKVELSNLPEKLYLVKSAGWLHDLRLKKTELRHLKDFEMDNYQTLSLGNCYASEYVLENAIIEYIEPKPDNIIF